MLTVAEPYRLWAIEGPSELVQHLPFFNRLEGAVLAGDIRPWRERKLRILNGAHSFLAALGWLAGCETVLDCMRAPLTRAYLSRLVLQEIVPSLPPGIEGGEAFAQEVLARFANPFLRHALLDITLQYSSKVRVRNLPTLLRFCERSGKAPQAMALGFAAFLRFSLPAEEAAGLWQGRRYALHDAATPQWRAYAEMRGRCSLGDWISALLADEALWGQDLNLLPGWAEAVGHYFAILESQGADTALRLALASPGSEVSG
jgi:tagaturonate reductase